MPASLIVTVNVYAPAFVNVAVLFFAALVPLAEKLADPPLGTVVAAHVYVSAASPASSAPSTLYAVVVPVTGLGVALAAVATVGAALVTVIVEDPVTFPLVARIVAFPAVLPELKLPDALIEPTPENLLHVNVG